MKLRMSFVVEVENEDIPKLCELAGAEDRVEARTFLLKKTYETIEEYLSANGIAAKRAKW